MEAEALVSVTHYYWSIGNHLWTQFESQLGGCGGVFSPVNLSGF